MNHIFLVKSIMEEYLEKDENLIECAWTQTKHNRIGREALWDVLKMHGAGN